MDNCDAKSRSSIRDRESLAAFAIYCGLSLLFFGRGLIGHFGDRYIGVGSDPAQQMYFLAWWPFALAHHLNPFLNNVAWFPETVNLAHSPCIPLPSILMAPITMLGGPILSFNLLMLLSPAISAWAGFILFRRICGGFWPASAGGYVFGFSPFILSHLLSSPVMIAGWFIPLAIYTVLLRLDGEISAIRFAALAALVLIGQAGWSLELLATASLFGSIALALAAWTGGADLRRRIFGLAAPLVCAYAATGILLSPYLYYLLASGGLDMSPHLAIYNSANLMNFIVPTQVNALGATPLVHLLTPRTHIYDTCAYIGVPALLVAVLMTARRGAELAVRLSVWMLLVTMILSVGPMFLTGPHSAIPMPEVFIYWYAPVLKYALPVRFAAYFFLSIGALFALWMSDHALSAGVRLGLGALVILSLLPNLNWKFWTIRETTPQFFSDGIYRNYIARNENILILPYGVAGDSDLWQALADFHFRMAGGYLGITPPVPRGYRDWPIVHSLYGLNGMPEPHRNIGAFLLDKRVTKVVVPDGAHLWQWTFGDGPASWRLRAFDADEKAAIESFFGWLDPAPLHIGGVTIYRIPLDRLGAYARYAPEDLQLDAARARMRTLVTAANSYLAQGGEIGELSLVEAAKRGLIPRLWITGPLAANFAERTVFRNGLRLQPLPNGLVEIAIFGTRDALQQVDQGYRPFYRSARLLPPQPSINVAEWSQSLLEFRFDRAGLAAAALAQAAAP
jgi:hypothetical protein